MCFFNKADIDSEHWDFNKYTNMLYIQDTSFIGRMLNIVHVVEIPYLLDNKRIETIIISKKSGWLSVIGLSDTGYGVLTVFKYTYKCGYIRYSQILLPKHMMFGNKLVINATGKYIAVTVTDYNTEIVQVYQYDDIIEEYLVAHTIGISQVGILDIITLSMYHPCSIHMFNVSTILTVKAITENGIEIVKHKQTLP